jgi:hypothetical protein
LMLFYSCISRTPLCCVLSASVAGDDTAENWMK